ncbi:MAG TPA: phosphoribosylformylglycinamidine synthase subunit PurQ, partial [Hyphomicrobiales bacterium]|nr:phosphoribosylformylglycinamidine synthase subunit PurQ [Hyphomicrobiales bacterium]
FSSAYAKGQVIRCPVAHHDGNYFADAETIARLEGEGRVVYRYCDETGAVTEAANVNGSINSIAGILNERGNVLGMMPHPENLIEQLQGGDDGRGVFESLVGALAA